MKLAKHIKSKVLYIVMGFLFLLTGNALAYIDPGSLGSAYQFGYLIFYSVMGALVFFFRPIKNFFVFLYRIVTGRENKGMAVIEENIEK